MSSVSRGFGYFETDLYDKCPTCGSESKPVHKCVTCAAPRPGFVEYKCGTVGHRAKTVEPLYVYDNSEECLNLAFPKKPRKRKVTP
jgi:hypothetical protein